MASCSGMLSYGFQRANHDLVLAMNSKLETLIKESKA